MVMLFNLWCYIVHQTVKYCVVSIWRSLEQALFVLTRLTGNLAVAVSWMVQYSIAILTDNSNHNEIVLLQNSIFLLMHCSI